MVLTLLFSAVTAYLSATERHPGWASALTAAGYALSGVPVYWLGYVVIYVATTRFNVFPVMSGTSTSGAWMFLVPVVVLGLNRMYTAVVDHGAHAMHHTADHVVLFDCVERFHSEA